MAMRRPPRSDRPRSDDPRPVMMPGCEGVVRACAVVLFALGCYRDVPTSFDQAPLGSPVRALVAASGMRASSAGPILDVSDGSPTVTIQGTLLQRDGQQLVLSVPAYHSAVAAAYEPQNAQITVARQDVLRLDVRKLDGKRTGGLVTLIAGAAVVATLTARTEVGGSATPRSPSGDVSLRGVWQRVCCR